MSAKRNIVDVRIYPQVTEGVWRLPNFHPNNVYIKDNLGQQVGSIGKNTFDGRIEAAVDARYDNDPNWDCLFSR